MALELKIKSVIGFSGKNNLFIVVNIMNNDFELSLGKVANTLKYTPCGNYIVYPMGSFVVIKNVKTDKEAFLDGHGGDVSCIAVSHDGSKLASGQSNIVGVKVQIFFD